MPKTLRENILAKEDLVTEIVHIVEWNVDVAVKTMTAGQRAELLDKCVNKKTSDFDSKKLYVYTAIYCICDPETGEQLFKESDYEALKGKSSNALDQVLAVANKINSLGESEVKAIEKN